MKLVWPCYTLRSKSGFFIKSLAFKIFWATVTLGTYQWCLRDNSAHPPLPTLLAKRDTECSQGCDSDLTWAEAFFLEMLLFCSQATCPVSVQQSLGQGPLLYLLRKWCEHKALQPPLGGHGRLGCLCVRSHLYTSAAISNEALTPIGAAFVSVLNRQLSAISTTDGTVQNHHVPTR